MKPTLDEFLSDKHRMPNAYIKYAGFSALYVRKADIGVSLDGKRYWCRRCFTIANVTASRPNRGSFSKLVKDLVDRGLAVYVENAHAEDLQEKLKHLGFAAVNSAHGPNFLLNFEGHLEDIEKVSV